MTSKSYLLRSDLPKQILSLDMTDPKVIVKYGVVETSHSLWWGNKLGLSPLLCAPQHQHSNLTNSTLSPTLGPSDIKFARIKENYRLYFILPRGEGSRRQPHCHQAGPPPPSRRPDVHSVNPELIINMDGTENPRHWTSSPH